MEILRYSSYKHPSKNDNDTFAHWTTKLLKKLSRVVHKGAGWTVAKLREPKLSRRAAEVLWRLGKRDILAQLFSR